MSIEERIKSVIIKALRYYPNDLQQVALDNVDIQDLNLDSIQLIGLILELENEFGITFDEEDMKPELLNNYDAINNLVVMKAEIL